MALVLLGAAAALVMAIRLLSLRPPPAGLARSAPDPTGRPIDDVTIRRARFAVALCVAGVLWIGSLIAFVDWFIAGLPDSDPSVEAPSYWSYHRTVSFTIGWTLLVASGPVAHWLGGRRGLLLLPAAPLALAGLVVLPYWLG